MANFFLILFDRNNIYTQWLNSQNLVKRMVGVLRESDNQNALENAASLLIFIIQKGRQSFFSEEEERKFYRFYT